MRKSRFAIAFETQETAKAMKQPPVLHNPYMAQAMGKWILGLTMLTMLGGLVWIGIGNFYWA